MPELRTAACLLGISLDATEERSTTAPRRPGAFRTASSVQVAARTALSYVVTVVNRDLLPASASCRCLRFAGDAGALEVHVLEPAPRAS